MYRSFPDWLMQAKSIAIVGYGREGKSTAKFLKAHFPQVKVFIFEKNEELFVIPAVDVIFKSPGIPLKKLQYDPKSYMTSQTDLFVQLFGSKTIAITGTKGKSTTAHVINHVLNALGHPSILLGNIGAPALDFVERMDDGVTAVFEMSAFQTETLHTGPHIAVFTSLYQDHLDYYDKLENYVAAKRHLFDLLGTEDLCLYRDDYQDIVALLSTCQAEKIGYNSSTFSAPVNAIPAVLIARTLGASDKQISAALATVKPLPGRLELVATKGTIRFYDDALATIPEATINALDTLGDDVRVLIAGGHERHQDFSTLAERIAKSQIQTMILFPPTGTRLAEAVRSKTNGIAIHEVSTMEEAVRISYESLATNNSSLHSIVLLSTAAPSFGVFKDYTDRSRQYLSCIQQYDAASRTVSQAS